MVCQEPLDKKSVPVRNEEWFVSFQHVDPVRSSEKSATVGRSSRTASTRPSGTKTDDIIIKSYEMEREFAEKQAIKKYVLFPWFCI